MNKDELKNKYIKKTSDYNSDYVWVTPDEFENDTVEVIKIFAYDDKKYHVRKAACVTSDSKAFSTSSQKMLELADDLKDYDDYIVTLHIEKYYNKKYKRDLYTYDIISLILD